MNIRATGWQYTSVVFFLGLALNALAQQQHTDPPANNESLSLACPSQDFAEFFEVFSERIDLQQAFTVWPLKYSAIDVEAEPAPAPVHSLISFQNAKFPLVPGKTERKEYSMNLMEINKISPNHVEVQLGKDDTDFLVSYFFTLDSCWKMYRIEDHSL